MCGHGDRGNKKLVAGGRGKKGKEKSAAEPRHFIECPFHFLGVSTVTSTVTPAKVLKKTGISLKCDENFSDRVCNPCTRKIHNFSSLYTVIEGISQKMPEKRKQHMKRLLSVLFIPANIRVDYALKYTSERRIFVY